MSQTFHPPLLVPNPKLGFRFGQKYPAGFESLTGKKHLGQDYLVPIGTPVYALDDGILKYSTGKQGGITINLVTDSNLSIRYMHLDRYANKAKTRVTRGELIGYSGNTGVSNSGGHLHIDVYNGRITRPPLFVNFIDPLTLNYQIKKEKPMADIKYTGEDYITRICENYEILQVYPDLFLSHKYKFKDGEFAWNSTGGFRDFVKWWANNKSKEDFKKAVEADYQTWLKEQSK